MEPLDHLLHALGLPGASPDKFLEADLGLDLVERMGIREDIEERLHVVISDAEIEPDLTTLELAGLLSRKLLITPDKRGFDGKLAEDIVILASFETVSEALRDATAWPGLMPNARAIQILYENSPHQEFVMVLDAGYHKPASLRFVRRCDEGHIACFQPEPDSFLKHLYDDWFIRPLMREATHLTVVRRWTLSSEAEALFPSCDGMRSEEQVAALLRERARNDQAAWKRALERRVS